MQASSLLINYPNSLIIAIAQLLDLPLEVVRVEAQKFQQDLDS